MRNEALAWHERLLRNLVVNLVTTTCIPGLCFLTNYRLTEINFYAFLFFLPGTLPAVVFSLLKNSEGVFKWSDKESLRLTAIVGGILGMLIPIGFFVYLWWWSLMQPYS